MERSDIENCSVCCESFGENIRPHCLPCGHSYCTSCLHNLFDGGNITCPECMHVHRGAYFPINYHLEESISNYKKLQLIYTRDLTRSVDSDCATQRNINCGTHVQSVEIDTMMQGIISDQKVNTENHIQANKDLESGLLIYETFLTDEKTKHLKLIQKIKELAKLNEVSVKQIDEELQRLPKMKNYTADLLKLVEERLESFEKANGIKSMMCAMGELYQPLSELEKWSKQCHQLLPNAKVITNSEKMLAETRFAISAVDFEIPSAPDIPDLSQASLTISQKLDKLLGKCNLKLQTLRNMAQTNRNLLEKTLVYAVHLENERARFAQVTFDSEKLYLHCLRDGEPPTSALTIKQSEFLESLDEESVMVFMDLSWEGLKRGRIFIKLFPGTFHGNQFRMLCTGEWGKSYAHSKFLGVQKRNTVNEFVWAGNYDNRGGASITQEFLVVNERYTHPSVTGVVFTAFGLNDAAHSAQFGFQTGKGKGITGDRVFGQVEIGLDILKQAVKINDITDVEITECGLVLPLNIHKVNRGRVVLQLAPKWLYFFLFFVRIFQRESTFLYKCLHLGFMAVGYIFYS